MKTINYNAIPDEIKERLDDCMIGTLEIMDKLQNDPVMSKVYKEIYL